MSKISKELPSPETIFFKRIYPSSCFCRFGHPWGGRGEYLKSQIKGGRIFQEMISSIPAGYIPWILLRVAAGGVPFSNLRAKEGWTYSFLFPTRPLCPSRITLNHSLPCKFEKGDQIFTDCSLNLLDFIKASPFPLANWQFCWLVGVITNRSHSSGSLLHL